MKIPSFAITFCFIGLMAGSLCAESIDGQTLNQQERENVPAASTRRLLLPQLSRIHHPAPPEPVAPNQNYARPYPPARPAPKEDNALPGPPTTEQNQDAYKSVNCGDRLCAGIRIGRRIFVLKLEK